MGEEGDMGGGEAAAGGDAARAGRPRVRPRVVPRLGERDQHLLGLLGVARYLDLGQLNRLVFPGRDESVVRRRLATLAGGEGGGDAPAYVQRVAARGPDGARRWAWRLADAGYVVAEQLLGAVKRPAKDVKPAFMHHELMTNELLVGLLSAGLTARRGPTPASMAGLSVDARRSDFAKATDARFKWTASDSAERPWSEYDQKKGERVPRVIQPDAILEVPRAGARLFIENEMGTHPLAAGESTPGATTSKVQRYLKFVATGEEPATTFYRAAFKDGLEPQLVIVVHTAARAQSAQEVVGKCLRKWELEHQRPLPLAVRVLLLRDAVAEVLKLLPAAAALPAPQPSAPVNDSTAQLSAADLVALRTFYAEAMSLVKQLRDAAKAQPGAKVPEYPRGAQEVYNLLQKHQSSR